MLPCQPKWNACTDCHPRDRGSAPVTPPPRALAAAWLGGLHAERLASPKPQAIGNLSGCASTFRGICSGLSADALGLAQFHECLTTLAIAESERPFCPD